MRSEVKVTKVKFKVRFEGQRSGPLSEKRSEFKVKVTSGNKVTGLGHLGQV